MKCSKIQKFLAVDKDDPRVRNHLAGCLDCQRFASDLDAVSSGLASAPKLEAPPAIWLKLAAEQASRRKPVRAPALVFGLATLLVVVLLVWPRSSAWAIIARAKRVTTQTRSARLFGYYYHIRDETLTNGVFRPAGWEHPDSWIVQGKYRHEGWGEQRVIRRDGKSWSMNPRLSSPHVEPRNTDLYSSAIWANFQLASPHDSPAEVSDLGSVVFEGRRLSVVRADHPKFESDNITITAHEDYLWFDQVTGLPVFFATYASDEGRYLKQVLVFEFDVHIDPNLFEVSSLDTLYGHHNGEPPPSLPPLP
jgi:hypothetical protein